ncbi:trafficking protein particle complex II-specific subunit 120 homolog isoform X2 [Phalaenopsis equestris]|uniref:trafficking protein particle complex II-specific subunit 120 homolog isoform X2 n=1 Tax=Phalaenopsis equestris TaxID=78828 RepID=UPI0009E5302A|nr:trafficking protein particle complex II-specific subunit 120 homolog isoform X2 [Phalaenopsis equestris]
MEPDVSIETGSMIRIAVIPVGGSIPHQWLREYVSMLSRHTRIDLSSISSFYSEHQKSPFTHQPWESGSLLFKYMVGGAPPSPWEDFQAHRKILAVIGLCHCPASPDLDLVIDQFASVSKGYGSALAKRLFAFSPSDEQLREGREKENSIILFPSADQQAQELQMLTMIQDVAATLLMEFEKWVLRAESTGTILKTPLDSQSNLSSEEVIKAKKRRLARAQKTIGDYCLLAGSPVDANAHFVTAIELARLTGDIFWHAGALEGSVCALLVGRMDERDSLLEEEVKYRYYSVIQLYKRSYLQDNAQRVSTATFELEAQLKLARYLCRRHLVKEVVELLMNASDGAKSLIDPSDCLILYVEIARLFGALGYQRKAAFFSRQVAQLYLKQDNVSAAISAMQVLSMTSKAYHVERRGTNRKQHGSPHEIESCTAESGKNYPQSIISLFESQWSTLQMVVLREILMSSVRAGDPLAAWSAAARLLRSFYPLITPAGQSGLASSLANSADRLRSGTRCADPVLPFIRLHSFRMHPSQMEIIKRNPAKNDWWTDSAPSGPFIYTPFSKGGTTDSNKLELNWIVGEPDQVLVELANPCAFELSVESIYLSIHSGNFDAFPVRVNLPPNTAKVVLLSGIPTKIGPVSIPGCIVHCFGVITEHLFRDVDDLLLGAAQGLVLSDPFRCCGSVKLKNVVVPNITVISPLPLLVSYAVGGDGAMILYEGEIRDIRIRLTNAGTVPIEQAHISLSGRNQNSVTSIAHESLNSALPLKPGAEVSFIVTIKAWKLSLADSGHDPGKNTSGATRGVSTESSNPFLVIHYAGPISHTDEFYSSEPSVSPGRRLVVPLHVGVVQGLRFVKARLFSMEIPARVSVAVPQRVSLNESDAEEITAHSRIDSLVKIDPYRGSWELRLLELELSNPTDVVFDVNVSVQFDTAEFGCPKTRIDHNCSARVLVPLEHFKLPVLDNSLFAKGLKSTAFVSKSSSFAERNTKAELAASISNLVSKIKVRWQSGRNSSGELNIKDAVQAALQTSVMDILLPDPLTFGFRLTNGRSKTENIADASKSVHSDVIQALHQSSISVHEMTDIEVLIRNNTRELIQMSLSINCRDVAGDNCIEGDNATVLWAGILSGISLEIPPLEELVHPFSLYFLVPGEYTLLAAAVIDDENDVLRARARTDSADEPIFCRGSPFRIIVTGTL